MNTHTVRKIINILQIISDVKVLEDWITKLRFKLLGFPSKCFPEIEKKHQNILGKS